MKLLNQTSFARERRLVPFTPHCSDLKNARFTVAGQLSFIREREIRSKGATAMRTATYSGIMHACGGLRLRTCPLIFFGVLVVVASLLGGSIAWGQATTSIRGTEIGR